MTTVLAERFRAPVDGLTGPRIEDVLDVCVSATIDAPDPMKHQPGASFHQLTQADLECRRLAFVSSSNSELRHRKKNSMTTTIAATAVKVALQAARLCARFSADALRARVQVLHTRVEVAAPECAEAAMDERDVLVGCPRPKDDSASPSGLTPRA
jgi:hypothetical protein